MGRRIRAQPSPFESSPGAWSQSAAPAKCKPGLDEHYSTVTETFSVRVMLPLTAVTTTVKLPVGDTGIE
jgi:hypothetical protein